VQKGNFSMKIVILDGYTLNPGDLDWSALQDLGEYTIYDRTSPEMLLARAADAEILLTNKVVLNRTAIEQLPNLKYIGVLATGYNVVDVVAAREHGISVTNVPAYSTSSVAQQTIALLLELTNRVGLHNESVHNSEWSGCIDFSFTKSPLIELQGKTLGIFGYGAIGKAVAQIGIALGMKILTHSRNCPKEIPAGIEWTPDRNRLFTESDVLTLHCPLTNDTQNLICNETIAMMKPSAFLINTGRGPLVNELDLADALRTGKIAGAAMDVLSTEPPSPTNPLLSAPNCIITPHIAWATGAARQRLLQTVVDNIIAFQNDNPQNVVN
jgi:glycerate dehydrogenase